MDAIGLNLYLTFLAVSFLLIVVPGPSILLIVSNSLARGLRQGLVTVAGTSVGMMIPLTITTIGLGALARVATGWLEIWRWAGVGYLAILGLHMLLRARYAHGWGPGRQHSARSSFWEGFFVSLANPATTPFFLAYLPQFVSRDAPALPQLVVLGVSFLLLALLLDTLYALGAARLGRSLRSRRQAVWRQTLSGALMLTAAVALALVEPEDF